MSVEPPATAPEEPQSKARPARSRRQLLVTIASVLIAGLVLGLLVWREREALQGMELSQLWPALLVGQVAMAGGLLLAALLWAAIMRALGSQVARLRHVNIYAITYLQRYLPGTVWYVVGRGVLYRDAGDSARLVSVASGIEMMLTMMSGAVVVIVLLFTVGSQRMAGSVPAGLVAVTVGLVAGAALLHPASMRWALQRLKLTEAPHVPVSRLALWLALYCSNWLVGGFLLYVNARALLGEQGAGLPLGYIVFAYTLVATLSIFLFFLPSNFGLTEIGVSLLLSAVMPSSVAVLAAVLTRVLMIVYAALACSAIAAVSAAMVRRSPPAAPHATSLSAPD